MAKFVIECPSCGRFAEASTNFFARKKIDCTCGHVINVRTEKLASKVCPHCGNTVVYDQSKGEKAVCPVCHEKINTRDSMAVLAEFTCPSCSCKLSADKSASNYRCPLCDTQINVQERIAKETVKNQGLASVIKYEGGNDIFVWKHPIEDFNLGSQLIVHESQEAVFFRDGRALDRFEKGRYTLTTQNIPLLENLYKLPTNTTEVFHSEVYFINMTTHMGIKWGTDSRVRLFDPASGLHVEIGAYGEFSLRVCDSRKLLVKLVGTETEFAQKDVMLGKFKALVMNRVKANLARIIRENQLNILAIDEYLDVISEKMRLAINEKLEEYGLEAPEFFVTAIMTPDDDPDFKRLKQQFAERTLRMRQEEILKAEAEAAQGRKILEAQTDAKVMLVGAQAEAEAYRMKAHAEADEMRDKGFTYQQQTAREVGLEAMQNGITGGSGGGSLIGDVASLGVALGAMGGVANMTREALDPMTQGVPAPAAGGWACTCGKNGITSNFCPDCGTPQPKAEAGWDCACGCKNITSNFCPDCGTKKPEKTTWDCACGCKNITSKYCPDCGTKKPEAPALWNCPGCGKKGIASGFCPECGQKRED